MSERERTVTSEADEQKRKRSKNALLFPLEDLWKQLPVFPLGSTWDPANDELVEHQWSFSNLQEAFKKDGLLHTQEKVYLFCHSEYFSLHLLPDGPKQIAQKQKQTSRVPTVIAIVSSFIPSSKFEVHKGTKEAHSQLIVEMKEMNMAWVPYSSSVEVPLPEIYVISSVKREGTLENVDFDPTILECKPYFDNPYKVIDKKKQKTVVDIDFPTEAGTISCKYSWKRPMRGLTLELTNAGKLSSDKKDAFEAFVESMVEEKKRANEEEIQKQTQDLEELRKTNKEVALFDEMKFYKFYPVSFPGAKSALINHYYGMAHKVV